MKWSGSQPIPTSAGVLCKSHVSPVARLYVFFRIQLGDGHLKQFLDQSKALNPEERGELLEKAEGIINTHKELALEGQTKVRKLHVIEFSSNISCVGSISAAHAGSPELIYRVFQEECARLRKGVPYANPLAYTDVCETPGLARSINP